MIIVTGSFAAKEGCLAEALRLSQEHVARSRSEPGCLSHAVYQEPGNTARLFFYEQWADRAALGAHFALPASRGFAKAVGALAVAAPELSMFEAEPCVP
jgi:quinol monooxygenase YgiN